MGSKMKLIQNSSPRIFVCLLNIFAILPLSVATIYMSLNELRRPPIVDFISAHVAANESTSIHFNKALRCEEVCAFGLVLFDSQHHLADSGLLSSVKITCGETVLTSVRSNWSVPKYNGYLSYSLDQCISGYKNGVPVIESLEVMVTSQIDGEIFIEWKARHVL